MQASVLQPLFVITTVLGAGYPVKSTWAACSDPGLNPTLGPLQVKWDPWPPRFPGGPSLSSLIYPFPPSSLPN